MAVRAMNFKLDETDISDVRKVAEVYNKTMTDVIKEAIHEYLERIKNDPYYRLTVNVEDASAEESAEILDAVGRLTDDDLAISSAEKFTV